MEVLKNAIREADTMASQSSDQKSIMDEIRERKSNGNIKPQSKYSISSFLQEYMKNDGPVPLD